MRRKGMIIKRRYVLLQKSTVVVTGWQQVSEFGNVKLLLLLDRLLLILLITTKGSGQAIQNSSFQNTAALVVRTQ